MRAAIGINFILSVFCLVWVADIAAYFGGRALRQAQAGADASAPARAGRACGAAWPACSCWRWPGCALESHFGARQPEPVSASCWHRLGLLGWPAGAGLPGRHERGRRPGRVAGQARRRRQGSAAGCCPATAACSTASTRCCRCSRCRWPCSVCERTRSPCSASASCILGSTGSVGTSTLDVVSRHPERFEVFALTRAAAHRRADRAVPALAAALCGGARRSRARACCASALREQGLSHRGAQRRAGAVRAWRRTPRSTA